LHHTASDSIYLPISADFCLAHLVSPSTNGKRARLDLGPSTCQPLPRWEPWAGSRRQRSSRHVDNAQSLASSHGHQRTASCDPFAVSRHFQGQRPLSSGCSPTQPKPLVTVAYTLRSSVDATAQRRNDRCWRCSGPTRSDYAFGGVKRTRLRADRSSAYAAQRSLTSRISVIRCRLPAIAS